MARVADFMVDSLRALGVRRIYGVVGDSLNALTEALRQRKEIPVSCREPSSVHWHTTAPACSTWW